MKKINFGVIGCGGRGSSMAKLLAHIDGTYVSAVCDYYEDRANNLADAIKNEVKKDRPTPYTDADKLLESGIEAVMISTSWETHIPLALQAMKRGIITLVEVCGTYDINDCFELVKVYEETKTPIMFLENCCYGKDELLATALARNGVLGKVVHCDGAYGHDLRAEITRGEENRHYRLKHYTNYNSENYPTHELGPIAKLLGINRGNRMVSLVSMASLEAGLTAYVNSHDDINPHRIGQKFAQGDIVTTMIKCENGETITLRLDTSLPRHYNRNFTVHGTKGLYEQGCNMVFLDGMKEVFEPVEAYKMYMDNGKEYEDKYLCKEWTTITPEEIERGHGGMDAIMLADVVRRIQNGDPMSIDIYDMASWIAVTALSKKSIEEGGTLQEFPDFTHGEWKNRPMEDVVELPVVK